MNWLAHLRLGGTDPLLRLGHLAGDFCQGARVADLPAAVREGIAGHRAIDRFTDRHPVVRGLGQRIEQRHRRIAGIWIDVWFDHVLTERWPTHGSGQPLEAFVDDVHRDLLAGRGSLPPRLAHIAPRLVAERWLLSYGTIDGVRAILTRMQGRSRRELPLAAGADELARLQPEVEQAFEQFWPELVEFAGAIRAGGPETTPPPARAAEAQPGGGFGIP